MPPRMQFRFSVNYTDQRTVGADLIAGAPYETDQVVGPLCRQLRQCDAARRRLARTARVPRCRARSAASRPIRCWISSTSTRPAKRRWWSAPPTTCRTSCSTASSCRRRYGWAWDAVDAPSGTPLTRQNEFNVELEYLPTSGPLENIHVQVFYSMVELPDNPPGETQQPQVRGIVTYLVPLL